MTDRALLASGDAVATTADSTSLFASLGFGATPGVTSITTEAAVRTKHKGVNAVIDRLTVRSPSNARTTATTLRVVKNGSASGVAVSFAAGQTGVLQDLTNTVSLVDGDTYSLEQVMGTGGGSFNCGAASARLSTEGQAFAQIAGTGSQNINVSSTTRYLNLPGLIQVASTTENTVQVGAPEALTASNLQVYVTANARTNDTTVKSRKNGADGTQIVTIPAGTTGFFEDTTHTDSLAAGDLFNTVVTTLSGTQIATFSMIGMKLTGATANQSVMFSRGSSSLSAGLTRAVAPWGRPTLTGTEATIYCPAPYRGTWSGMGVDISANASTTDVAVVSRVNGATGSQSLTIPAGTTGTFRDASGTDTLASGDLMTIQLSGATTSTVTVRGTSGRLLAITTGEYSQSVSVGLGLAPAVSRQAALHKSVSVGLGLRGVGGTSRLLDVAVDVGLGLAAAGGRVLAARAAVTAGLGIAPTSAPSKVLSVAVSVGLGLASAAVMAGRRAIMNAVSVAAGNRLRLIAPGETQEFSNDWASWLGADTIEASSWSISPEGPVLGSTFFKGTETTVLVSEAELGGMWRLTNTVTTATGRVGEKGYVLRGAPK